MNMSVTSISKKLLPVAAAVALAFTGTAQATDLPVYAEITGSTILSFDATVIPVTSPDVLTFGNDKDLTSEGLSALDAGYYNFFTQGLTLPSGDFNFADYYAFRVDPSESVGVAFGINLGGDHQLTNLHARVFYFPTNASPATVLAESVDSNDGFFLSSVLEPYSLNAGNSPFPFYLEVLGNVAGTDSSSYSGQLSFVPAPVPVPAAVWLLGSALTSVVAAGRRKATAA